MMKGAFLLRLTTISPLALFTALMIFLSACSSAPEIPPSPLAQRGGNFDTTASITYRELSATARITRETPRSCIVTFTSPQSLAGITFVFWGDRVDLNYGALSFTFDPNSVPGGAVASIAAGAINSVLSGKGLEVDYTNGVLTLSGKLESGEFLLQIDGGDGSLLTLSVPEQELEIEFLGFTFLD